MKAIILAAGRGVRLSEPGKPHPPKSLLKFDGQSLLERHIRLLQTLKVEGLTLVVGYQKEAIVSELERIDAFPFVELVDNPDFTEGSIISLWCAREQMSTGDEIVVMDADVLYHPDILGQLIEGANLDRIQYDRGFVPGDEPVKLCFANGRIVEFRKRVTVSFDTVGEWPGFVRLSGDTAATLANTIQDFVERGDRDVPYEDALRHILLGSHAERFDYQDVTGLPWIEIDFPEDIAKAEQQILPSINT